MKTADFDYLLPASSIAQTPVEPRDAARLLVLHRDGGLIEHRVFRDIEHYLQPGDLLVVNDTRVIPARLHGRRATTGGRVELLLVEQREGAGNHEQVWEALARPARRLPEGAWIDFDTPEAAVPGVAARDGALRGQVVGTTTYGGRLIRFVSATDVEQALESRGVVPLPPYIHSPLEDRERYQTIFARCKGSVAAPTAGLHLTVDLIDRLRSRGVGLASVTLHIGIDTFKPVQVDDLAEHRMHSEFAELPAETAAAVEMARARGRRVVAIGTTVVRVLETAAKFGDELQEFRGRTDIFIRPGHSFKAVDALVTNFHLPRSTLLVLVSAFAGRDAVLAAYDEAVHAGYRLYSFGDAMLIV